MSMSGIATWLRHVSMMPMAIPDAEISAVRFFVVHCGRNTIPYHTIPCSFDKNLKNARSTIRVREGVKELSKKSQQQRRKTYMYPTIKKVSEEVGTLRYNF